jgi:hypothetical protein
VASSSYPAIATRPTSCSRKRSPGTSEDQVTQAPEAAHDLFEAAGVDPIDAGYQDRDDAANCKILADLWEAARRAATAVYWAPRIGTPGPTKIDTYFE